MVCTHSTHSYFYTNLWYVNTVHFCMSTLTYGMSTLYTSTVYHLPPCMSITYPLVCLLPTPVYVYPSPSQCMSKTHPLICLPSPPLCLPPSPVCILYNLNLPSDQIVCLFILNLLMSTLLLFILF